MDVHPDASLLLVALAPVRTQGREGLMPPTVELEGALDQLAVIWKEAIVAARATSNASLRGELCDRAFHLWWLRKALLGAVPLRHDPFADDALHRAGKRESA